MRRFPQFIGRVTVRSSMTGWGASSRDEGWRAAFVMGHFTIPVCDLYPVLERRRGEAGRGMGAITTYFVPIRE